MALDSLSPLNLPVPLTIPNGGTGQGTAAGARTALGLEIGTNVQAQNPQLQAIAGLTSAADKGIQFTGTGTAATFDLTAAGKALLAGTTTTQQLQTLGAAWQKIYEGTVSSVSSINLTNAGAYRTILIRGWVVPATTNTDLRVRLSTNNGSSYDSTSGRYLWRSLYAIAGLNGQTDSTTDSGNFLVAGGVNNATGVAFEFTLEEFNQARECFFKFSQINRRTGGTAAAIASGGGYYTQTTARDAFQLLMSSGNIASGHLTVEGLI